MVCIPDATYVACMTLLDRLVIMMSAGLHINKSLNLLCVSLSREGGGMHDLFAGGINEAIRMQSANSEDYNKLGYLLACGLDCFSLNFCMSTVDPTHQCLTAADFAGLLNGC